MDIFLPNPKSNIRRFMREAGYAPIINRFSGETSYERPLVGLAYPRFHIYASFRKDALVLKLHLDQKKPSYEGSSAHNGEYSGSAVETEAERIKNMLKISNS